MRWILPRRSLAAEIEAAFHARHEALYTYSLPDQDVVLVNARASVVGRLPPAAGVAGSGAAAPAAAKSRRRGFTWGRWTDVPVFDFAALAAGQALAGPAIVESDTTTVLLRAGDTGRFASPGWLEIAVGAG